MPTKRHISKVRAEAGRRGGIARWANVAREKTVQVRVYDDDARWLRAQPGTVAEAVRRLRERGET